MKDKNKKMLARIVTDLIMSFLVIRTLFFLAPFDLDRFNCLLTGGMVGAYIGYRYRGIKLYKNYIGLPVCEKKVKK